MNCTAAPRVLLLTAVLTTSIATTAVAADASATTTTAHPSYCHGKRATIVGEPGWKVSGTRRGDVIVSHGAREIDGGAGDDVICITGDSGGRVVRVFGNGGADLVDARDSLIGIEADPGGGPDVVIGSPEDDVMLVRDGGSDRVYAGAGHDSAAAGGSRGRHDHDVIHLGPGDDTMPNVTRDPTTRWYGDAGFDTADLPYDGPHVQATHDWVYDVPRHGTFRDGARIQSWQGFERYDLFGRNAAPVVGRSMRFVGGPRADQLLLNAAGEVPTRVNLGAGADRLELYPRYDRDAPTPHYVLTGGPGRDDFLPAGGYGLFADVGDFDNHTAYLKVDLPGDAFTTFRGTGPRESLKGFEDVDATYFDEADLTGDATDNRLLAPQSCTGDLAGGGGDDVLAVGAIDDGEECDEDDVSGPDPGATLLGGPGSDVLMGGAGNDTLTGGDGADTADGGAGTDTCDAESVVNCP